MTRWRCYQHTTPVLLFIVQITFGFLRDLTIKYRKIGTQSSSTAKQALAKYNKPLWNVEEYSTFSDETGGLCWIRCVVDDYVRPFM